MTMPIDLGQVDWLYVAILALFALVANLVANLLSFRRRGLAAVLAAVLFCRSFRLLDVLPTRVTTAHHAESSKVYGHNHHQFAC